MNTSSDCQANSVAPQSGPASVDSNCDPRVLLALQEWFAAQDAGEELGLPEFLERHSPIAAQLQQCLKGLKLVDGLASQKHESSSGRPASSFNIPLTGQLGDFRLVREIGRGGMGIVYEAVQISLGRRVALKVLPFAAALDDRQLQRFKNEAHAAAQLHHNHIVPVFFVGCERGVHFYAMQLIEGKNLADVVRDLRKQNDPKSQPPTLPYVPATSASETDPVARPVVSGCTTAPVRSLVFKEIATLMIQPAEALEHAHQMGVVHRDIKPANLLLDKNKQVWVTDFGLARLQTDAGLTASGDVLGTLRYMSPEQASGKPNVDHRTDVYSLGATLYELLALKPAFDGRTRKEIMRLILEEEPPSLQTYNRAVPADLETIVLKAMAKLPNERYATA